jgi:hypothetical protein
MLVGELVTTILARTPEYVQLVSTGSSDRAYQINHGLARLEQFMLLIELL